MKRITKQVKLSIGVNARRRLKHLRVPGSLNTRQRLHRVSVDGASPSASCAPAECDRMNHVERDQGIITPAITVICPNRSN